MSTMPVTAYPPVSPSALPGVTVTPIGPLPATAPAEGMPIVTPVAIGWTDAYVGGYPAIAPNPIAPPPQAPAMPLVVPASPMVVYASAAVPPASLSISSMLDTLRHWLSAMGSHLAGLVAPPATPAPGPGTPPPATSGPKPPGSQPNKATTFVVSSFNILGSNHTAPGGDAKGYAPGTERIREAAKLLQDRKVDVVGFQELQADQVTEFKKVAGDTYALYPGNSMGPRGSQNSIAYRKDKFAVVEAYTVKMPSHRGMLRESPVMRLRDKQTGEEVYVVNVHNAPGFHKGGAQQQWRDKATAQQVDLLNRLKRSGLPVILTGDMNEKEKVFQRMSREADMNAANELPSGKLPKRLGIDWIFGSQDVTFKAFERVGESVSRKISDHAMLVSKVKI